MDRTHDGKHATEPRNERRHLLLTVLGVNPRPACYELAGRQVKASLAPVALLELLPEAEKPDYVLALCTPEAKQSSWPVLQEALHGKCGVAPVAVPAGDTAADVNTCLASISGAIHDDVDLTVDVTHGFRHFSFLTYVAVLYLSVLRGVRVRGAYYGMLNSAGLSPFLDLRPLLELPRWIHALQVLHDTGSTLPIARILDGNSPGQLPQRIAKELCQFSQAWLSGLPLELGRQAAIVAQQRIKPLRNLLRDGYHLPLAGELTGQIAAFLKPFALSGQVSGDGWKQRVALSKEELNRQTAVIDGLLQHGSVAAALGLMREWTVSWVAWLRQSECEWLDYANVRRGAAGLLNAMRAVGEDPDLGCVLTPEQRSLGAFWGQLSELRNGYHHHGMRPQVLIADKKADGQFQDVLSYWESTLRSCPEDFPLALGDSSGGRVLISPIGMRPGVLYSALHACRTGDAAGEPVRCLVVCSPETQGKIDDVVERAGYKGAIEPLVLRDAFGGGRPEIDALVKAARKHLVGAEEVLVNVTGGTTLMGLAAEALAGAGRDLACPVRRFGLIDRRSSKEQDADPYQVGEPFWLDAGEGANADRD